MHFKKLLSLAMVLVMACSCMCVTAFAENSKNINLEDNTSTITQEYTLTTTTTYNDTYKVKVEWTVSSIDVDRSSTKTWNVETMQWDDNTEVTAADQTATFTFTNYSSKQVKAKVSFTAAEGLTDTLSSATFKDGTTDVATTGVTVDTMVNTDHSVDTAKKATVPSKTITATLKFDKDAFVEKSEQSTAATYGTFTTTIESVK